MGAFQLRTDIAIPFIPPGLLSLIIAFNHSAPVPCTSGGHYNVTSTNFWSLQSMDPQSVCITPSFPNGCSATTVIRPGSTNSSQWVPAPHVGITFGTATLLCAACCTPAFLSIITSWKPEEVASTREERWVEEKIRLVVGLVLKIAFLVCIFATLILGESNFWSREMQIGVESVTAIGQ